MSRTFLPHVITDDSALGGSVIERSLRFNDDDSAYLNRTPSSSSNRKTFTISWWFKRGNQGTIQAFFGAYDNSTSGNDSYYFSCIISDLGINLGAWNQNWLKTNRLFRDPNAWYHCVLAYDTTQSTADNRVRMYINGVEETSFAQRNNPSQYYDLGWNFSSQMHTIGRVNYLTGSGPYSFDGYIAEFNSVDGQQLDPTHFGYTESQTGLWRPKKFIPPNRPNNGATWSSTTQFDANVFDGDYTDSFLAQVSNGYYTATTSPFTIKQSLGVITGDGYHWGARFNGSTEVTTGNLSNTMGHGSDVRIVNFDLSGVTLPFDVTNLQLKAGTGSSGSTYIYGIVVDGVVLIDGDISNIGLNGFHLEFKDNSSTSALGKDTSNNRNDFTTNNFSVTDGKNYDSMIDTPTNNFPTLNPLRHDPYSLTNYVSPTLRDGNLNFRTNTTSNVNYAESSIYFPESGKWYIETTVSNVNIGSGVGYAQISVNGDTGGSRYLWWHYASSYYEINTDSGLQTIGSISNGDIIQVAYDADTSNLWFGKNNSWYLSGDPSSATPMSSATTVVSDNTTFYVAGRSGSGQNVMHVNFGQRPFNYTPPTGFKALCSKNLPPNVPSIIRPQKHFDTLLYTGDGAASGRRITGLQFQPDFVWIKNRGETYDHHLYDSIRGVGKYLESNDSTAEATGDHMDGFLPNGFSVGQGNLSNRTNANNKLYVGWSWKAGGAAVSNTDGTITSQVSANKKAGFSIVTYTGDGSSGKTVGHGLDTTPVISIRKARNATLDWFVHHTLVDGSMDFLRLNTTAANSNSSLSAFTSTTLPVDDNTNQYVSYCWHDVPGYSKFGSYLGDGTSDGQYVHLGFRPAWVMIKQTNSTAGWMMYDSKRSPLNQINKYLQANYNNAEVDSTTDNPIDFLSNGMKMRYSNSATNSSSGVYIYMAFAEQPGTTPFDTFPNAR